MSNDDVHGCNCQLANSWIFVKELVDDQVDELHGRFVAIHEQRLERFRAVLTNLASQRDAPTSDCSVSAHFVDGIDGAFLLENVI